MEKFGLANYSRFAKFTKLCRYTVYGTILPDVNSMCGNWFTNIVVLLIAVWKVKARVKEVIPPLYIQQAKVLAEF